MEKGLTVEAWDPEFGTIAPTGKTDLLDVYSYKPSARGIRQVDPRYSLANGSRSNKLHTNHQETLFIKIKLRMMEQNTQCQC